MGVAATASCLLQRGGGSFMGPIWAWPGLCWPGVLLLLRPVCYYLWRGGGCSLPRGDGTAAPCMWRSFRSGRPRIICHGETSMMIARPWWRVLVGDMFGGARWIVRGCGYFGDGRNPSWLGWHRRGDACGRRHSFLKGVGYTPSPLPSVYREKS
jgi:hypothetical protein